MARFCADRWPLDDTGSREGAPVDRTTWSAMADLGVLGLLLPEHDGGAGLGAIDGAIVFELLGRHLAPGPILWTLLAAPLVAGAATGERLVGGVDASAVVGGTAVVPHAADIDVLLVVGDEGVAAHDMTAANSTERLAFLEPLDPLTPVARVAGLGDGEPVGDAAAAAHLRTLGTVLTAALLTGVGDRSLDVARDYALDRHQFGVPIGSFQAVKHMLADMYLRTVSAQSATYAAAAVLDDPAGDDPGRATAGAKVLAADAALENASTAIQVLGGMGFTWAMLPNYLLKRAWVLENEFGVTEQHERRLGATLAAG